MVFAHTPTTQCGDSGLGGPLSVARRSRLPWRRTRPSSGAGRAAGVRAAFITPFFRRWRPFLARYATVPDLGLAFRARPV
eukprot:2647881-Prymnesium_polylepis.2